MGQVPADMFVLQREQHVCLLLLNFKLFNEDYQICQLYGFGIYFPIKHLSKRTEEVQKTKSF